MSIPSGNAIVELVARGATEEAKRHIESLENAAQQARHEVAILRQRIVALEQALQRRGQMHFDGQFYWTGDEDDERDGPFCQTCFDAERLMMRLQFRTVEEIDYDTGYTRPGGRVYYQCLRCSSKSSREVAA